MENFSFENLKPYSGLIIAAGGIVFLLASILDADWLFSSPAKSYNIEKVEGWVNLFGRKTTRVIAGILSIGIIAFGIFWFWYDVTVKRD